MKRRMYRVGPPANDAELAQRLGERGHVLWVGGPLPRSADGLTLGRLVIVRRAATLRADSFDRLLRHEQVHVAQFREFGTLGFVRRYVGSYLRFRWQGHGHLAAYRRIPLEVEARWHAGMPVRASIDVDELLHT